MRERDFQSFLEEGRQRFVSFVRSMLVDATDLDAEDVVHDVLVRMMERDSSSMTVEHLTAYVYRSLRNRVIDLGRSRKVTLPLDGTDADDVTLFDVLRTYRQDIVDAIQQQRGHEALFEAFDVLTDIEREVVVAHEFEGTSFRILASERGIPVNTLLSHKARAISKLRAHLLKERGETP